MTGGREPVRRVAEDMIVVNGEGRPVPADSTIPALLADLDIDPGESGVAVAING